MRKYIANLFLLLVSSAVQAQTDDPQWNTPSAGNPFVPGYFADPTIRKFGDIYYLYTTTDGTGNGYGPAQVWMSYDFTNWRNMVMNWPTTEVVWAPDVALQENGTYRYYYCEPCNIIVGEGSSPVGPWHNILGKENAVLVPDRYIHNVITLDPQLFRDDNGDEYLYFTTWGIYDGFGCGVAKLNPRFLPPYSAQEQSDGKRRSYGDARRWHEDATFPIAADSFFLDKRLIPNTELKDIFEAPFVFKRNGIYYFTYSSGSCHDHTYRVQYATSTNGPMGPFEYKGCILQTNADGTIHGPGHHSILQDNDRYYIVYHRHNNPHSAHGFNRQVCIDEMKFDANGNILPITPTHDAKGVEMLQSTKYQNLAYGCQVTASSFYDEWFVPSYAVDDNNATMWKASNSNWGRGGRMSQPEWLQIDLGKAVSFNEVWTQFEYATFFYQYKIETSLDGRHWTLYADRTDNTTQGSPMIDRKAVKSRYLRITITDTQKNGHIPAIWNVKVWQDAPPLPPIDVENSDYPGMHRKDVSIAERQHSHLSTIIVDANEQGRGKTVPADISEITTPSGIIFEANKPIRLRVKDGKWGLFFNGSQSLTSNAPLPHSYCYNAPYTISTWALQTEESAMATIASLSNSRADLGTTEFHLGTDPQSGIINHNGSFENSGLSEAVKSAVGSWHHWVVTFDGWMEHIYLDGELLHERNNFIMVRPEGRIVIGADGSGTNNFRGYLNEVRIMPHAVKADEVKKLYDHTKNANIPSLGDEDFDESDPDSRFTLTPDMKSIYELVDVPTLSAETADFNASPATNGGHLYKEVTGDFVVMCRFDDMEGYKEHRVKAYNEVGLLIKGDNDCYYQLGVFPLYNCGNMLTMLSPQGRPQYPNYKGYDAEPIMQFERRGNKLFARTSSDGQTWHNMPGSPMEVSTPTLEVGVYQTTYTATPSWAKLKDFVIYQTQ